MRGLIKSLPWTGGLMGLVLLLGQAAVRSDEIGPAQCGPAVRVRGDINHYPLGAGRTVEGATDPAMYLDEVYGKRFEAVIEGLPAGRYTVNVYLAETFHRVAGARLMSVTCGDQPLAERLDPFARVGADRELRLSHTLDHPGDSVGGPITLRFETQRDNAKFNAITVENAQGRTVACVYAKDLRSVDDVWAADIPEVAEPPVFHDANLPFEARVEDLIRRLSVKEKIEQLMDNAPPIERLGVPGYNYWNECLHGVARAGHATVFPQAIGLAATWDSALLQRIADTIATEARAKNNLARAKNPNTRRYEGLTFWTPNINIYRDPRWGRGQETYGEDPTLTARLAVAFIRGLQGDDSRYLKAMACAKHFAVHSGPEKLRHEFNVEPSERDLYETYLPQFEAAVREADVGIVMAVYNAVYGIPGPASRFLLTEILRDRWGFAGHVVSDCGAVRDIWRNHRFVPTPEEAAALAIKAGTDLNCGQTYAALTGAVRQGLVTEADLDRALRRVLRARFQLGLFDSPQQCAYLNIPPALNTAPPHAQLALEAARKSVVLLTNDGTLPLDPKRLGRIAVIGPNADSVRALEGNYHGDPVSPVTVLNGIRQVAGNDVEVTYAPGCPLTVRVGQPYDVNSPEGRAALEQARQADGVVFVGGLDADVEGEEMGGPAIEGLDRGDRVELGLPSPQRKLIRALVSTGKPVVLVCLSGGGLSIPWEAEHSTAVLQAWYPGQAGGTAVAEILFGRVNPSGRLPVTVVRSVADLPAFTDYSMANRTYRYFQGRPLFAFGHGLSYTRFEYGPIEAAAGEVAADGRVRVTVTVRNAGPRDGEEVVQWYVRHLDPPVPMPVHSLAGFQRVALAAGQSRDVGFDLPAAALRIWDTQADRYVVPAGRFEVQVGRSSADIRSRRTLRIR